MPKDISVVIVAGGKSSRMGGADKAFARVGGKPIIERILQQLDDFGAETIVITNKPEGYRHLGLPLFADLLPDQGALGGLYTAVHSASRPHALVVACDMPFVNLPLLDYLASLAPEHDAVVPRLRSPLPLGEGRGVRAEAEPFRAIYSKACVAPMRAALDAGQMRVISFFPEVRVRFVDEPEIDRFDPAHLTFFNINTPGDLARAEEILSAQNHRPSHRAGRRGA